MAGLWSSTPLNDSSAVSDTLRSAKDEKTEYLASEVAESRRNTDSEADSINTEDFQNGVQRVRGITSVWSRWTLVSMVSLLYLVSFVNYLQNAIDASLSPYITSNFGSHGLVDVAGILATVIGGCAPLPLAKIIDIWGRVEGFTLMLVICIIGMIMKAVAQNLATYVAAHTLYWVGYIGIGYVIKVMLSDMTSLRNRMILFALNDTPRIASTFAGPAIGELFYNNLNFRWAFGAFSIILAVVGLPAIVLMIFMFQKARKQGLIEKKSSGRSWTQSVRHNVVEFDLLGIIIIVAALTLLLLPFSLVAYAPHSWSTPYIIAMIVVGVVLFPIFYIWEAKFAPVQFLPFKYLKQGTVIGSCFLYGIMFMSTFCWDGYFYSYLQVVHRQSIEHAGYITNTYSLAAVVFGPLIAWIISYTGNFKWTAYTGVPIMLIGTALLIPLRSPSSSPGVLAFTQILVGVGSEIFSICSALAVMAPVTHQQIAVANAIAGLFGGVGAAIGLAIGGGMWNNLLPQQIYARLPDGLKDQTEEIFSSLVVQLSYADGSPERDAIVGAYSYVMRLMVIVGACLMPLCILSIFVWKNINVRKIEEERGKQTKGTVF